MRARSAALVVVAEVSAREAPAVETVGVLVDVSVEKVELVAAAMTFAVRADGRRCFTSVEVRGHGLPRPETQRHAAPTRTTPETVRRGEPLPSLSKASTVPAVDGAGAAVEGR
jgi:hypothetical protein